MMDGNCVADGDADSDDVDDRVANSMSAGICNGPGAIYNSGCADIGQGDCDFPDGTSSMFRRLWRNRRQQ